MTECFIRLHGEDGMVRGVAVGAIKHFRPLDKSLALACGDVETPCHPDNPLKTIVEFERASWMVRETVSEIMDLIEKPVPTRETMLAEGLLAVIRALNHGTGLAYIVSAKDHAAKALGAAGWTIHETYEVAGGVMHARPPEDKG